MRRLINQDSRGSADESFYDSSYNHDLGPNRNESKGSDEVGIIRRQYGLKKAAPKNYQQ